MQIGIVGLPNVGKSTLFNALTKSSSAMAANYPFCTIDPNVGVVEVPDERIDALKKIVNPERVVPAIVEFVDIAGLVKGASEGEGLGNQFLSHIRECDAIAEVVRIFEDGNIIHVHGKVDPKGDKEVIEMELILADIDTMKKRSAAVEKDARAGKQDAKEKAVFFTRALAALEQGVKARDIEKNEDEQEWIKEAHLLTMKPILYVANVTEDELIDFDVAVYREKLGLPVTANIVPVCAKLESELAELTDEEAQEFLTELGIKESGRNRLIREAYAILGLETYFTAGVKEVRAWTYKKGFKAPQCAGVIHTDFEKGFICADVIFWKDFVDAGGEAKAKEKGLMKMQGKEYVMRDGDVCHFKFNN